MTFYFLRHADKAGGEYITPGLPHRDQPISGYGKRQARKLRRFFRGRHIDEIYVSEYIRTAQTIRPVARRLGIEPVVDRRLNEMDLGHFIGMSDEKFQAAYPEVWKARMERKTDFRWPGGETGEEALGSLTSFLDEQAGRPGDKMIVTHYGIVRLLLCHLLGLPVYERFRFSSDTAGITEIEWMPEQALWRIIRFNQEVM